MSTPTPAAGSEERTLVRTSPSQVLNADVLGGALLVMGALGGLAAWLRQPWFLAGLPVPLLVAFWKWLELRSRTYEITTERIRMSRGVLTRRTEELELYRVKDVSVVEPFLLRAMGLGHIIITTSDASTPVLTLSAIRKVREVREDLRKCVEACRERKRVRLAELE